MTQNLRIVGPKTLTSSESDIAESYQMPSVQLKGFDNNWSWGQGDYILQRKQEEYGAYYTWLTATAGSGSKSIENTSYSAPYSICPKKWRLPKYSELNNFKNYYTAKEAGTTPFNFIKSGMVNGNQYISEGQYAAIWGSNAMTCSNCPPASMTHSLSLNTGSGSANQGLNVRCIVKE